MLHALKSAKVKASEEWKCDQLVERLLRSIPTIGSNMCEP